MAWRIVKTTDNQHCGELLESVAPGQVLTFKDGDVVPIEQTFHDASGEVMIAYGKNYEMTLKKE